MSNPKSLKLTMRWGKPDKCNAPDLIAEDKGVPKGDKLPIKQGKRKK